MAPPSILFLFFFFFVFYLQFHHNIAQSSSCPASFDCPGLGSLTFPLSTNDSNCGLFMVNCTSQPVIQLRAGGNWYEILEIISPNSVSLHDPRLQNLLSDSNCFAFGNLSLPVSPSASFTITPSLTLFQCINGSEDGVFRNDNFERHSCGGFNVFYRNPTTGSAVNQSYTIPNGCNIIEIPINPEQDLSNPGNFFQLFSSNFTLEWMITNECVRCHGRGGQCSTSNMNGYLCREENAGGNSISSRTITGIVFGALLTIILVVVVIRWKGRCSPRKDTLEYELRDMKFQTSSFTYQQLKTATNSFDPANKIGEGGFGPVYKGTLSDGTVVAIKLLSSNSRQGNREFVTEIGMISALQHPNLVKLYGCCVEGNNLLLMYEYMENNSLARALFGSEDYKLNLDWPTRHKICVGVARGLAYLHEESALKIVHRDIKAANVLLDENLMPKISDFGLAKLHEENYTHISTRVAGTLGYMSPEYAMEGYLTDKADVYSFGVVLLEIVSGRTNNPRFGEEFNLLRQAKYLNQNDNLMELVDPRLESSCNKEEILATINIALICTNFADDERPSMSTVVSMLMGSSDHAWSFNLFHVQSPGQDLTQIPVSPIPD